MCVEDGFFFKISKHDFTFIREMRVPHDHFFHWVNGYLMWETALTPIFCSKVNFNGKLVFLKK